jgi:putative SOS response-associated peptidase YedK
MPGNEASGVVANGLYEWKNLDPKGKEKQPYAIGMADDKEMIMAGLWATWKDPKSGAEIQSCTVLTCGRTRSWGSCTIACR